MLDQFCLHQILMQHDSSDTSTATHFHQTALTLSHIHPFIQQRMHWVASLTLLL